MIFQTALTWISRASSLRPSIFIVQAFYFLSRGLERLAEMGTLVDRRTCKGGGDVMTFLFTAVHRLEVGPLVFWLSTAVRADA